MRHKEGRILLAKPGWDGHDRGIVFVAQALKDAGCEVIYLGRQVTPEEIVVSAVDEDVDMIGLGFISIDPVLIFREVRRLLRERNAEHIELFGGGIVSEEEEVELKDIGVGAIFRAGTRSEHIFDYVRAHTRKP